MNTVANIQKQADRIVATLQASPAEKLRFWGTVPYSARLNGENTRQWTICAARPPELQPLYASPSLEAAALILTDVSHRTGIALQVRTGIDIWTLAPSISALVQQIPIAKGEAIAKTKCQGHLLKHVFGQCLSRHGQLDLIQNLSHPETQEA